MNSLERVFTALNHGEPDFVPLDLGGMTTSGLTLGFYKKVCHHLSMGLVQPDLEYPIQAQPKYDPAFLKKLQTDVRGVSPAVVYDLGDNEKYQELVDEWGIVWRKTKDRNAMYNIFYSPLLDAANLGEIRDYSWPDPLCPKRLQGILTRAQEYQSQGYPVVGGHWVCGIMELAMALRGYQRFLEDLYFNPRLIAYLLDTILELKAAFWENALPKLVPAIRIIKQNDDLGTQNSLVMSPQMYRKFIKPRHRELFRRIKEGVGDKVYLLFHSCGSVSPLIPDFIESGIDILNPLQVDAENMDPQFLKRKYGRDLVFWGGGISTQKTLPFATRAEIKDEVKRRIEILAPGGGYVFAPDQAITSEVEVENFMAMWEAFQENKAY